MSNRKLSRRSRELRARRRMEKLTIVGMFAGFAVATVAACTWAVAFGSML